MRALAEHHWSGETLLALSVVICLALGAGIGWVIGAAINNIGVGISLGAFGGLVIGVIAGVLISDRGE